MILTSVEASKNNNFNGQFAFINKHARNFDKREKKEVTSIASHAAGFYYHKLKKNGTATRSPSSSTSRDTSPDNDRQLCKSQKLHQRPPKEPTILLWDTGIAADVPKKRTARSKIQPRRQARALLTRSVSPCSHDPFDAVPYRMGPKTTELTQIWARYFMNLRSPAGASKQLRMVVNQSWQKHVSGILEDHMQACAFFAGALAIKARFLAPETGRETWPEVYRLHTEALAGLRERLHNESYSEGVLLTMFTVGSVNFYSGDWADNRKHKSAANHVTTRLGGFDALSDTLKDYMIEGCLNTSYCLMTRPRFYHRQWVTDPWESQPLSYKWPVFVNNESPPFHRSGTSLSGDDPVAAARLSSYFRSYREFVGVCSAAQSLGADDIQDRDEMFIWLSRRRRTMRVQCLDYWCDLRDSIDNNSRADRIARSEADNQILQDRLHQALVLGAFCLDSMQIHQKRCHATALPMWLIYLPIPQLRKALHTVLETMTSRGTFSHPEALLWLFYVGACAEENARTMGVTFWPDDLELNCQDWFLDLVARLGLSGLEQVKEILRDFLYEDCFGDEYLELLLQRQCMF